MTLTYQQRAPGVAPPRSPGPAPLTTAGPVTITQLPGTVDLAIYQGDDFYLDLTVTDSSGGDADLTGFTATAQVRGATGDDAAAPMATFTCSIAGNVISLHLPNTEATNLQNPAFWDCQIQATDVITLVAGKVTVTLQVTQ